MDAHIHVTGNVGGDVEFRSNNVSVASFRLACTPRIKKNGDWVDGPTTWLTVTCFRGLAEHAASSIRRGDPVIVVGRLRTNVWSKDGIDYERLVLEATTIGHDLSWGTAAFRRANRAAVPADRQTDVGEVITSVEEQVETVSPDEPEPESAAA